jgi:hypothetical protein
MGVSCALSLLVERQQDNALLTAFILFLQTSFPIFPLSFPFSTLSTFLSPKTSLSCCGSSSSQTATSGPAARTPWMTKQRVGKRPMMDGCITIPATGSPLRGSGPTGRRLGTAFCTTSETRVRQKVQLLKKETKRIEKSRILPLICIFQQFIRSAAALSFLHDDHSSL